MYPTFSVGEVHVYRQEKNGRKLSFTATRERSRET